jgi:methylenetetrahydrofolate dehydrogenase (NADP+)/methenyltetrahydrofolate cyclohydrolase
MTATIIDGKAIAAKLSQSIADAVRAVTAEHGIEPGLAVVLVGDNAASEVYVRSKTAKTAAVNMRSLLYKLPATARPEELFGLIEQLNQDPAVHGILVQLPLPPQIDSRKVIEAIAPTKDVDGFHPLTAGLLSTGLPGIVPCTPLACIILAKHVLGSLAGKEAVVIGRSNIVGKPLAQLLLMENATVTIAHSKTRDVPAVSRRGDIVFAAVGPAGNGARRLDQVRRPSLMSASIAWQPPTANRNSSATSPSTKSRRSRARSRRCRAASVR